MEIQTTMTAAKRRLRTPKIIISSDYLARIEALAENAIYRNPSLAKKLLKEVGRARIAKAEKMPETTVSIGSTVTYRDEDTGQQNTIVLVFPAEADISQQKVSLMTPIGVALLGLGQGASIHWETIDRQRRTLTVLNVSQPDKHDVKRS